MVPLLRAKMSFSRHKTLVYYSELSLVLWSFLLSRKPPTYVCRELFVVGQSWCAKQTPNDQRDEKHLKSSPGGSRFVQTKGTIWCVYSGGIPRLCFLQCSENTEPVACSFWKITHTLRIERKLCLCPSQDFTLFFTFAANIDRLTRQDHTQPLASE